MGSRTGGGEDWVAVIPPLFLANVPEYFSINF